jgi:outer membrane protein TolC
VGVTAEWNISEILTSAARQKERKAQQHVIRASRYQMRDQVKLEVGAAYYAHQAAQEAVVHAKSAREATSESLEKAMARYNLGQEPVLALIEAETANSEAVLREVDAHIALRLSALRLAYVTAAPLSE